MVKLEFSNMEWLMLHNMISENIYSCGDSQLNQLRKNKLEDMLYKLELNRPEIEYNIDTKKEYECIFNR